MVIGIDASRASRAERTGTEWYSYHVIEHLKSIVPPDVTVRLYGRERLTGDLAELPSNWQSWVLSWTPHYLWTILRLSWEMLRRPPDVLFVPAHGLPLVLPRRTVAVVHDIGFERLPHVYRRRVLWYHRFVVRNAIRRADAIVTISEWTKAELATVFPERRPSVFVTPLAHDAERYHAGIPIAEQQRAQTRYGLVAPYFLFVGRIERKKNVRRIVEAFASLRRSSENLHSLVLVGPMGYGADEAQSIAAREGLADAVHFLDWVPAEDLPPLLAGAAALVFPTLYEGFGIPILEAMAVGTPVVTSDRGANREVAGDAALLVDPEDVTAIAAAMRESVLPASAARLRAAGFRRAANFRWESTARATWEAMSRVAST